jgi:hypothetical protein
MARYVKVKDDLFQDTFFNEDYAQNHAMETFGAKLINGQLCDKNGDKKPLKEIFENDGFKLEPLKNFIDSYCIAENEVTNVHIEDGQLVVTLKDGSQKKIKY